MPHEPVPSVPHEVFGAAGAGLRLARERRGLLRDPTLRGDATVLVIPGFGTTDAWTLPFRRTLARLGHAVHGWELGRNTGEVRELLPRVRDRVRGLHEEAGSPVAIVGWSLGGVFAREVARRDRRLVARVITLGSPVQGGPKYTATARTFRARGLDLDQVEAEVALVNRTTIAVPLTSIYSRADSIVHWEASLDPWNDHVEHLEVSTTHGGLVLCPRVLRLVAERLAAASPPLID